jgi:hypothetical protein
METGQYVLEQAIGQWRNKKGNLGSS